MTARWLTVAQTAEHAQRSQDYVRRAAAAGELRGRQAPSKSGRGHWRFAIEDVDAWIRGDLAAVVVPIDRRRRA